MDQYRLADYLYVQNIAKEVMGDILPYIQSGVTEQEIAQTATQLFQQKGITEFWYYGIAALVLVGERTPLSLSGREYKPSQTKIANNDLVTIDLSPTFNGAWGDYARSIYVHEGKAYSSPQTIEDKAAHHAETMLHDFMIANTTPDTTAHHLWLKSNELISAHGFRNLDFKQNLGHSIETEKANRKYIEKGNMIPLKDFGLFTFEPHIQSNLGGHGYKHENIHYFLDDRVHAL